LPIHQASDLSPVTTASHGLSRSVFGLAIFISAFLLFQVQLLLGKFLLPWFGGTSAIWTTCLLFFQLLLLAGYVYAHQMASVFRPRVQGKVHLGFLAMGLLWIIIAWYFWKSPLLPDHSWKPAPGAAPILGIVELLVLSVGVPFLLLSTTGPLLQSWYAQLGLTKENKSPYFLYALSNAGSLLGLLSYPFLLEPAFRLNIQSCLWGAGFVVFVLCCAWCAWQMQRSSLRPERAHQFEENLPAATTTARTPPRRWLWFVLPMFGSVMLLATTNLLTQDVAPIPLLWVLPLCIYLLSFILTFHGRWYQRAIFHPLFALTALLGVIALFRGSNMWMGWQIGIFLALLFAACMVCHGELARIKPHTRHLTSFYLSLSAGGAAGGIFVAIIAPLIFPTFWEFQLGLWAIAAVVVIILFLDRDSWLHDPHPDLLVPIASLTILVMVPKYLVRARMITIPEQLGLAYNIILGLLVCICVWLAFAGGPDWARRKKFRWYEITLGANFLLLSIALYANVGAHIGRLLHRERNFYGAVAVYQIWDKNMINSFYEFMHGRVVHGVQLSKNRKLPVAYYGEKSGAHVALVTNPRRAAGPMRVGAIGLGIGTLAAYSRPGDVYRFYELNPSVIRLAQGEGGYFTYLSDAAARIEIVPGDARLSLEGEAARGELANFDVLFVDAFNGDSIPVHLLTREAMDLYLSHLRGLDSVIVVNVTNFAINLVPVVTALAEAYDMKAILVQSDVDKGPFHRSAFILLTRGNSLNTPEIQQASDVIRQDSSPRTGMLLWTDEYSDVLSLLLRR
jgi:spermidine synthase